MSYLIYLRKSRQDSELESLGIDVLARHEKTLLELAKSRKLPIGGIYREVVSGDSIDGRPEMTRLLSEVEAGSWDGVLVMEIERLARGDTIDQGRVQRAFFYSQTLIITPSKTYDPANESDNEYFEFNLFMSRREYAAIKRRMQNGRVRSVKDGYYVGSVPPYGWKRIRAKDGKHYTLAEDETEAPVLKLMYDFIGNKHYGYQKTCSALTKMGLFSRNGSPFCPSTVKGIIGNPVNIGMIRWNYRPTKKSVVSGIVEKSRPKANNSDYILVKAEHNGCVSPELFQRANTPYRGTNAPIRTDRPIQNLFAGLLYCSECGRIMVRKKANGCTPCDYLICQQSGCPTVGIQSDELEKIFISWLKNYVASYEFIHAPADISTVALSSRQTILHNLERQQTALLKQRSSLFDLVEQGIYTREIFTERLSSLEARICECHDDIASIQQDIVRITSIPTNRDIFIPQFRNLLDAWQKLNIEGKNSLLKGLIDKIVFTKTKKNRKGQKNSDFTIDVYPKVPR